MIYLDYAATTPMDVRVIDEMTRVMSTIFGNPSSLHQPGLEAQRYIRTCRKEIATLLGVKPTEIYFTSGGTEANNWAIKGVMWNAPHHESLWITPIEHSSVKVTADYLSSNGHHVKLIPITAEGFVNLEQWQPQLSDTHPRLVSVIGGNNEIGTIQPIKSIVSIAHQHGALVHIDAVQLIGQVPFSIPDSGADLVSFTAHKFYGPKGIGVLYIKEGTSIDPLLHGGHQENGRRAGTESPFLIGGLLVALRLALTTQQCYTEHLRDLAHHIYHYMVNHYPDVRWNGPEIGPSRLPGNLNFSFPHRDGHELVFQFQQREVGLSTGSACHADQIVPSHVIQAIGVPENLQLGTIRITLGRHTTIQEIQVFLTQLDAIMTA